MLDWGWYSDINTKVLFLHCLLKANWKAGEWHGIQYNAGEFITSLETLSKETSLTVSQVRTGLQHLILTGEIASKSQGKCRIITVNNWCSYQEDSKEDSIEVARSSQGGRKVVATDIEGKNDRKIEEKIINNINNNYPSSFNEFWECYPRKQDKGQAYKQYQARLNDGYSEEQLLIACKNYAAECENENREKRYIKHGATFLSVNEPFVDYLKEGVNNEQPKGRTTGDYWSNAGFKSEEEFLEVARRWAEDDE